MQVCCPNEAHVPHYELFHLEHVWEGADVGQVLVGKARAHLQGEKVRAVVQEF